MTAVHNQGPSFTYGFRPPTGTGTAGDYNADSGPNVDYQGESIYDVRYPYSGGNSNSPQVSSFYNSPGITLVDAVPAATTTANVAALQAQTLNVPLTLVSSTGAGVTVTTAGAVAAGYTLQPAAPSIKAAAATQVILALDGIYKPVVAGPNAIHDPSVGLCRAVSLTSAGNLSAGTFTVAGYDIYGYKMTETITGPNANTVTGQKAWKYIVSVTPNTSSATTVSVGNSNIFGLNLRSDKWEYMQVFWNGAFVTVSTGWTAANTTSPATALTGDVRGTYTVQSAADGVKRLAMFQIQPLAAVLTSTPTNSVPTFGVTQF